MSDDSTIGPDHEAAQAIAAIGHQLARLDCDLTIKDLATSLRGDRLTFEVPIGRGASHPILLYLRHLREDAVEEQAALRVALQIARARERRGPAMRRLRRLRRLAEDLAADARRLGARIEVASVALDAVACALVGIGPTTTLALSVLGHDLRVEGSFSNVGGAEDVRDAFLEIVDQQILRAGRLDQALRSDCIGAIDPVARATLAFHKLPPAWLRRWAAGAAVRHEAPPPVTPPGLRLEWRNGVIVAMAELRETPLVVWDKDRVYLHDAFLPEAAIASASGRAVTDLVGHHLLDGLVVASVDVDEIERVTTIVPQTRRPLPLRADGTVIRVPTHA